MWIDLKTENGFRVRNGQGLRICNYFYRMAYSFFTITSLKSSLKLWNKKKSRYRYLLSSFMRIMISISIARLTLDEFMKRWLIIIPPSRRRCVVILSYSKRIVYVHVYTYIYVYVCVCTCMHAYVCVCTCMQCEVLALAVLFYIKSLVICLVIYISFLVYTTRYTYIPENPKLLGYFCLWLCRLY